MPDVWSWFRISYVYLEGVFAVRAKNRSHAVAILGGYVKRRLGRVIYIPEGYPTQITPLRDRQPRERPTPKVLPLGDWELRERTRPPKEPWHVTRDDF